MALLASGIAHIPHFAAFDDMVKSRFENMDLSALLVYVVDSVPAEALFYLASQFDVLGWKGWNLAQTDADRRALIKKAIELHRYKGTIWAIKEAVRSVGFNDCTVFEHVGLDYNGAVTYNGSETYSGGHWANFRVKINIPETVTIDPETVELTYRLVLEYKNVRSHLVDLTFVTNFADDISANTNIDVIELTIDDNGTITNETLTYD